MYELFINFIDFNEGVNFRVIFTLVLTYLVSLWIIIVAWTFFDAKKRYKSKILPFVMALATFVLGIPFLTFYLLIRPDEHMTLDMFDDDDDDRDHGVNIPMVNFVGEEGVEMTLNLSVSPKVKMAEKSSDLKVDVRVETDDSRFVIKEAKKVEDLIEKTEELKESIRGDRTGNTLADRIKRGLGDILRTLNKRVDLKGVVIKPEKGGGREEYNLVGENNTSSKKSKKKKRKRKKRK